MFIITIYYNHYLIKRLVEWHEGKMFTGSWGGGVKLKVNMVLECELASCGSGEHPVAGSYEHSTEHLGSIKGEVYLT
jgi:hypothetical protein